MANDSPGDHPDFSSASLARNLLVSDASISSALNMLEDSGLIRRSESKRDRRKLTIALTEPGRKKISEIDQTVATILTEQWAGLGMDVLDANYIGAEMFDIGRKKPIRMLDNEKSYDSSYFENNLEIASLFRQACAQFGLSGNGFRVLFELYQHPDGIQSTPLASKLVLKLNELTQTCNILVGKNLVQRFRHSGDKRLVVVKITNKGIAVLEEAAPAIDREFMRGFGNYDVPSDKRISFLASAEHAMARMRRNFNPST